MESKKNVGIWIRVSTEDQARGDSPEHHEKRARHYAEAKEWHVVTVYHLEAVSGKSVMANNETKRMLSDIKDGTITGLIFSKLARLARNTKELLDFADLFRASGADLISLQEAIDTSTPAGRLFYTMIAAMAQWEREEISDRVAASVPIRAKLGKPIGGQASFGYRWDGKKLVIDEKEAPVRKLIYELFLKHRRKKTTASELNLMGHRTRNGSNFSDTTIDRLLRDPLAKGERRANYTKSLGDGKHWELKPESDWVITPCPAIISEETWNECNRILEEQEKKRRKPGPKAAHLLSGFIRCSCGKNMYIFHQNPVYVCKVCKNRIAAADIEEMYHTQLKTFLLTETDVTKYLKNTDKMVQEKNDLVTQLTNQSVSLRKRMDTLVQMRINGEMSKGSFANHYKPLEEQLNQIENQLPEEQAELDFLKIQYLSSGEVLKEANDLYKRWPSLEFNEKRAIVEVITNEIIIDKEDITFSLAYLPSHFLNTGKKQHNFKDS